MNDLVKAIRFVAALAFAVAIIVVAWPVIIAPALPELFRMALGN